MKVLVTGAAGFIGFHLCKRLLNDGYQVVGLDNLNDYYDQTLKIDRLKQMGIESPAEFKFNRLHSSETFGDSLQFIRLDLEDRQNLPELFQKFNFDVVCNLAAQAGVRYSLENPEVYIDSNIVGFSNLLECCRNSDIRHLVYASSSSVYGMNKKIPFEITDNVDSPISLYAATKKSNELMAYTYSHLYGIPTTGLRFFTVYGPWGRPDMAMFLFTDAILKGKPIKVFNKGNMERDFTFIDDIVEGLKLVINENVKLRKEDRDSLYKLYNIGNSKSVKLIDFITTIEKELGVEAKKDFLPIQPGDVKRTWANVESLTADYGYRPRTPIAEGVKKFITWFKEYYSKDLRA